MASQQENPAAQGDQAQIPVFICSLAMPGIKCPLHIFEPRYRDKCYRVILVVMLMGLVDFE